MVIYINNRPYEVEEGKNLLDTCLALGFNIPYFCWHPALGSVGACRLCAVKKYADEKDARGRIVMSCMEPLAPGLRISTDDPDVRKHRAGVLEWLMANHPHDCPVCDEGGECHLQDMTVMTGHNYSRYRFRKRTHANQYLGKFLSHEMNRCIQCYRCVRFYRDYAGGRDFDVHSSHDTVYFGRSREGELQSEFSGNLVEVCPTGVFTDKTFYRHYTRKWDLQSAPSVCQHCGLGCNTFVSERYGMVRRVLNRFNEKINGYFLCDRGRFGYEFLNSDRRSGEILARTEKRERRGIAPDAAVKEIAGLASGGRVIGIGSPRASMESNFALRKLVGADSFFSGMQPREHRLVSGIISFMKQNPAIVASLREIEAADAVLVLGEDATNTAPMLALSLRQALKNGGAEALRAINVPRWDGGFLAKAAEENPIYFALITSHATRLDDAASLALRAGPAGIARLGFAAADCITNNFPPPGGLSREDREAAEEIARALMAAKRPLVVSGTGMMSAQVISAAAAVVNALLRSSKEAGLFLAVPECNSVGMALLADRTLDDAVALADIAAPEAAIVLENDLYRRAPRRTVDRLLDRCGRIIVIDSIVSASSERADILLPSAPFAEADGTCINNEGRAQRYYRAMDPKGDVRAAWRWLGEIGRAAGRDASQPWRSTTDVIAAIADEMPDLAAMKDLCGREDARLPGQLIPRQTHRYSGRTSMHAREDIHERKPAPDIDSPLAFSMEGYRGAGAVLVPFYWRPGWNSVQSLNRTPSWTSGRGGADTGVRVVASSGKPSQGTAFVDGGEDAHAGEWLIVPRYHIFGSEEMSALAAAVAGMAPRAHLVLNEADAGRIGVHPGSEALLDVAGLTLAMPVEIRADVPPGIACYPSGMPGCEFVDLPARGTIRRKER